MALNRGLRRVARLVVLMGAMSAAVAQAGSASASSSTPHRAVKPATAPQPATAPGDSIAEVDIPGTATPVPARKGRHTRTAPPRTALPVELKQVLRHSALPAPVADDVAAAVGSLPRNRAPVHLSVAYGRDSEDTSKETVGKGAAKTAAARPHMLAVTVSDGHSTRHVYRYQTEEGGTAFLGDDGGGVMRLALGRPIATDNITSPFGWRIHPVFGDRRFHKGVDFGAPEGTPVVAAADGTVADLGRRGNYGLYLRLTHQPGVETAYAHLSRLVQTLKEGQRVHKGQVIGYVGRTGVATGPHLYYEVILAGDKVDPEHPPESVPVRLAGKAFAKFKAFVQKIRAGKQGA